MAKYLDQTGLGIVWGQIKEKFYSINDLDLEYGEGKIKLIGKEGASIAEIDAAPFIKDGMLSDVSIIDVINEDGQFGYKPEPDGEFIPVEAADEAGKYMLFTWNTDGGSKVDIIKLSDIATAYTEGEGISISPTNEISVDEVKTDITKTTADIPVAGGPLADLASKVYTDGKIPSGTNIQKILMDLFAKELYPSASVSVGKLTSAFAQPNVTVPHNGQTVEVGTPVTIPQFVAYEPNKTATPRTYSNFTYGWSAVDDDSKDQAGNPPSVAVTSIAMNTGEFTVKRTYTLFGKSSAPTTSVSNATMAQAVIPEDATPVVEEGSNTVKFDISGPGHKGTVLASPLYYIVSNFGNTDSTKNVAAQAQQDLSVATATASSKTYTVTGRYKFFFGYTSKTTAASMTSADIRALNGVASGWINPSGTTQVFGETGIKSDGTSIVIAVPNTYELKTVSDKLGNDMKATFNNKADVEVNLAGTAKTNYTVFMYPIVSGTQMELKNMTIGKK